MSPILIQALHASFFRYCEDNILHFAKLPNFAYWGGEFSFLKDIRITYIKGWNVYFHKTDLRLQWQIWTGGTSKEFPKLQANFRRRHQIKLLYLCRSLLAKIMVTKFGQQGWYKTQSKLRLIWKRLMTSSLLDHVALQRNYNSISTRIVVTRLGYLEDPKTPIQFR